MLSFIFFLSDESIVLYCCVILIRFGNRHSKAAAAKISKFVRPPSAFSLFVMLFIVCIFFVGAPIFCFVSPIKILSNERLSLALTIISRQKRSSTVQLSYRYQHRTQQTKTEEIGQKSPEYSWNLGGYQPEISHPFLVFPTNFQIFIRDQHFRTAHFSRFSTKNNFYLQLILRD
jgi:hypothetical protein